MTEWVGHLIRDLKLIRANPQWFNVQLFMETLNTSRIWSSMSSMDGSVRSLSFTLVQTSMWTISLALPRNVQRGGYSRCVGLRWKSYLTIFVTSAKANYNLKTMTVRQRNQRRLKGLSYKHCLHMPNCSELCTQMSAATEAEWENA